MRRTREKELEDLRRLDALLAGNRLTERDVEELGRKIKAGVARKHQEPKTSTE